MTQWKSWIPEIEVPSFLIAKTSFISQQGLILGFENESQSKKITFSFYRGFLATRNAEEGKCMELLNDLYIFIESGKCEKGILFKVENSDYLQWFREQSLGRYDNEKIEHYMIISFDVVSEVLSLSAPIIEITNKD